MPKASRGWPVSTSMPTRPMARPRKRLVTPARHGGAEQRRDRGEGEHHEREIFRRAEQQRELTKTGARKVSSSVPSVPATKEPMAAVASAAAPRPCRAIRLPSSAVMIEPDSPGVLSRIEVVELPYMAP